MTIRSEVSQLERTAQAEAEDYRQGQERPLSGYVVMMAVFAALVAAAGSVGALTGRKLPRRIAPYDLLLVTLGTHKLARTLSKESVTSPLRAPFTRYQDTGGPAEVMEEPRRSSRLRHAIGELVSCPFCLDMWVATGYMIGLMFAPRFTRIVGATFTVLTGADFLQLAYARAQQSAEG